MALTAEDIARLLTTYIPGYTCQAERNENGTYTLQFTNVANLEVITLPGFLPDELSSAPKIKRLSKVLFEEFVVAMAMRAQQPSSGQVY